MALVANSLRGSLFVDGPSLGIAMSQSSALHNSSVLGRLLQELSWVGVSIRDYRKGGIGYENVLTAEALQGLDFLPCSHFLGAVVAAAEGAALARARLFSDVEKAEFTLLPGDLLLEGSGVGSRRTIAVQPDGLITSPNCFVVLEAKRIRRSKFQEQQLAREFVMAIQAAKGKMPLLLLVLGAEPPVDVQGHGRVSIEQAIAMHLDAVLDRTGWNECSRSTLLALIPEVVAWTTWSKVSSVVSSQLATLDVVDPSVRSCATRLATSVTDSIARHS